jgi:hypothetical protein
MFMRSAGFSVYPLYELPIACTSLYAHISAAYYIIPPTSLCVCICIPYSCYATVRQNVFFVIPFYLQSVLVHSANCVKTCIQN